MEITEFEIETPAGVEKHILIDKGNGEFESMTKAVYQARLAAQEQSGTL